MPAKKRLDDLLLEKNLAASKEAAQALIMSGKVLVDKKKIDKPGVSFKDSVKIEILASKDYVGRGAYKLKAALEQFNISVENKVCADVGSSTGGFTEVLLQNGAKQVYAIDVGYGELDWKIRSDARVVVMERTNARYLETLPITPEFVSIDVSFISLKTILPAVKKWLAAENQVIALIKPQFEAKKEEVAQGGIVRDAAIHKTVVEDIIEWCKANDFAVVGVMDSPIEGTHGNKEFLLCLKADGNFNAE